MILMVIFFFVLYTSQERQVDARNREQLLQSFKEQESQSATKVCTNTSLLKTNDAMQTFHSCENAVPVCTQMCELQSSLRVCREELNAHKQQMEDLKKNFEMKLLKKNDKVLKLTKPCVNYLPLCCFLPIR